MNMMTRCAIKNFMDKVIWRSEDEQITVKDLCVTGVIFLFFMLVLGIIGTLDRMVW